MHKKFAKTITSNKQSSTKVFINSKFDLIKNIWQTCLNILNSYYGLIVNPKPR